MDYVKTLKDFNQFCADSGIQLDDAASRALCDFVYKWEEWKDSQADLKDPYKRYRLLKLNPSKWDGRKYTRNGLYRDS